MKKATGDNVFAPFIKDFSAGAKLLQNAGFDGVELWLGKDGWFNLNTSDIEVRRLREQAQNAGLSVSNVANALDWEQNVCSRDPAKRDAAFHHIRRQMETAQLLGTDAILIVAGLVDEQTPYNEVYKRTVAALQELAPEAQRAGVKIGVENCNSEQRFLLSPREFNTFLDDVNHPAVGIHLDVGNIHDTGFPEQWIEILGPRIMRIHLKDVLRHRGRCGNQSVYTNIFLGDNNWAAIRDALDKVAYRGWLIAELEARYRFAPDQQLFDTAAAMTRFVTGKL